MTRSASSTLRCGTKCSPTKLTGSSTGEYQGRGKRHEVPAGALAVTSSLSSRAPSLAVRLTSCNGRGRSAHLPFTRPMTSMRARPAARTGDASGDPCVLALSSGGAAPSTAGDGERLRLALSTGGMGWWEWEVAGGRLVWSPEAEALHGVAAGQLPASLEEYAAAIHPDD